MLVCWDSQTWRVQDVITKPFEEDKGAARCVSRVGLSSCVWFCSVEGEGACCAKASRHCVSRPSCVCGLLQRHHVPKTGLFSGRVDGVRHQCRAVWKICCRTHWPRWRRVSFFCQGFMVVWLRRTRALSVTHFSRPPHHHSVALHCTAQHCTTLHDKGRQRRDLGSTRHHVCGPSIAGDGGRF